MNNTITVNGLVDGISVVEKDNKTEYPHVLSDSIYNNEEPVELITSIQEEVNLLPNT